MERFHNTMGARFSVTKPPQSMRLGGTHAKRQKTTLAMIPTLHKRLKFQALVGALGHYTIGRAGGRWAGAPGTGFDPGEHHRSGLGAG